MTVNQGYSYRHVLGPEAAGRSVLSYLTQQFDHSNEAQWQCRIVSGELVIDGRTASESESLRAGSVLIWNRPPWNEEDAPRHFGIIYDDQQLLVVDKPSGLPTLPGAGFFFNTLLSVVQEQSPHAIPLHRLGRATSGLVLFAKNRQTAAMLTRNWSQVGKRYQALASGVVPQDCYDIQVPIGPQPHPRLGQIHAASPTGKPARSIVRVIQRREDSTIVEVDLLTGRPHQIRIHLAAIGHPLVGDPIYTVGGLPREDQPGLPGDAGYFLHAKEMKLLHPTTGQKLVLMSPLPPILQCESQRCS